MCDLQQWISQYLLDCQYQKGLDPKTIKAYRIDLAQFLELAGQKNFKFTRNEIMAYISRLHQQYKPKTIRRKIASIKAFFGYLEYEGLVQENPFSKLRIKLAIPVILPRTIPLSVISSILASAYQQKETARSQIQRDGTLRDIAVLELLFATGVRVSELCTLGYDDVRLEEVEKPQPRGKEILRQGCQGAFCANRKSKCFGCTPLLSRGVQRCHNAEWCFFCK